MIRFTTQQPFTISRYIKITVQAFLPHRWNGGKSPTRSNFSLFHKPSLTAVGPKYVLRSQGVTTWQRYSMCFRVGRSNVYCSSSILLHRKTNQTSWVLVTMKIEKVRYIPLFGLRHEEETEYKRYDVQGRLWNIEYGRIPNCAGRENRLTKSAREAVYPPIASDMLGKIIKTKPKLTKLTPTANECPTSRITSGNTSAEIANGAGPAVEEYAIM